MSNNSLKDHNFKASEAVSIYKEIPLYSKGNIQKREIFQRSTISVFLKPVTIKISVIWDMKPCRYAYR